MQYAGSILTDFFFSARRNKTKRLVKSACISCGASLMHSTALRVCAGPFTLPSRQERAGRDEPTAVDQLEQPFYSLGARVGICPSALIYFGKVDAVSRWRWWWWWWCKRMGRVIPRHWMPCACLTGAGLARDHWTSLEPNIIPTMTCPRLFFL